MESQVPESGQPREVVILGSTGSIGTQALDIVRRNPGRFRVVALAAGGGQPDVRASQAAEFGVAAVAVANPAAAGEVQDALRHFLSRTDHGTSPANPSAPGCPAGSHGTSPANPSTPGCPAGSHGTSPANPHVLSGPEAVS
ncbi:MAG: hypothetical protein ACLQB1_12915, partial [Streptosporangiaceae bacterium]